MLAKGWGALFVLTTGAYVLRPKGLKVLLDQMEKNPSFVLMTGYLSLILGIVTITLHNIWVADWPVVITLVGWMSLLKGISRMAYPEGVNKIITGMSPTFMRVGLLIALLAGLMLYCYGSGIA